MEPLEDDVSDFFVAYQYFITCPTYRVDTINLTLYIFGPTRSQIHHTGQSEVPLEAHSSHEDFEISHASIGQFKLS